MQYLFLSLEWLASLVSVLFVWICLFVILFLFIWHFVCPSIYLRVCLALSQKVWLTHWSIWYNPSMSQSWPDWTNSYFLALGQKLENNDSSPPCDDHGRNESMLVFHRCFHRCLGHNMDDGPRDLLTYFLCGPRVFVVCEAINMQTIWYT